MALFAIFLFGMANFALHRAVVESGHEIFDRPPLAPGSAGRKIMLAIEFAVLLAAMLLAVNGWPGLVWAYLLYTCANGAMFWLVRSGRI